VKIVRLFLVFNHSSPWSSESRCCSYRQVHSGLNRGSCNTSKFALLFLRLVYALHFMF
jgi:hypothetical protein